MANPMLATKLHIPSLRSKRVLRPRLIERLSEGPPRLPGVTLVAAPAGFGKTTLVSDWVVGSQRPTAWLSLDEGDNDLGRLLTYLVAALQTIAPGIGPGVMELLQTSSPQPSLVESILTALLNEIATLPDTSPAEPAVGESGFILVVDDYHLIRDKAVNMALAFLIEHMPPQMHLVITTREDPPFPLARLRARGQLTELRAADLRFTAAEAAEFLNQVMGLSLSAAEVAALEDRTEGWIAGLQLAALSMQNHQDVHGFIKAFAGDNRYIVDYLVEEVLQRQPEPIRCFLLQTAILERLSGSLCDAVTGQQASKARLEALERGNFFVVPLDDRRHWYRYHHLFAEVLRVHLVADLPEQVPTLHERASDWYEQHGSVNDAIYHAIAAQDFERAANLIERAIPQIRRTRHESTLLGWLRALPDELVRGRPILSAHYAWVLLAQGEMDGVETRLLDAEQSLDRLEKENKRPQERMLDIASAEEEEFRRLPGTIAIYRSGRSLALGDVHATVRYARQALELSSEEDHLQRGAAAALLALVAWSHGDLKEASRFYPESIESLQRAGHITDALGCTLSLADILITQGRLREAMSTYRQGLQLAMAHGGLALRGAADMHVGMSELYREQNNLEAATQHLLKSREYGEFTGLPQNRYRWRVAMARVREAQGEFDSALELLSEAEHLYMSDFSPKVRPVTALKTRAYLAQGRLDEGLAWVHARGLSASDTLSYLHEFEHVTLARVLLAEYRRHQVDRTLQEATDLLDRLLKAAEAAERMGSALEIRVLQALAHQMRGDLHAALTPLQYALTLAEPEGYTRVFLDEGPAMAQLLRETVTSGIMPSYAGELLGSLGEDQRKSADASRLPRPQAPLVEPLSQRELEVLRLFNTELSGPDIARELVIALSTLRTHTKAIYGKLNVDSRRMAVRRAVELGLI